MRSSLTDVFSNWEAPSKLLSSTTNEPSNLASSTENRLTNWQFARRIPNVWNEMQFGGACGELCELTGAKVTQYSPPFRGRQKPNPRCGPVTQRRHPQDHARYRDLRRPCIFRARRRTVGALRPTDFQTLRRFFPLRRIEWYGAAIALLTIAFSVARWLVADKRLRRSMRFIRLQHN